MSAPPDSRDDLACRELVELVTAYLEDAVAPVERARIEAHLAGCDDCVEYVRQIRITVAATGTLRAAAIDVDARTRLLALFRGWSARP